MTRFLQIHTLTSYPASLLNRDDAGFAKRMPFGGVTRTRVSSQCLKRHWRTFDGENSLRDLGPASVRSRHTFEKLIAGPLEKGGVKRELAEAVTRALMDVLLGKSARKKAAQAKGEEPEDNGGAKRKAGKDEAEAKETDLQTGQITVLGKPEVEYLLSLARRVCADTRDSAKAEKFVADALGRDGRKNLEQLRLAAGLDAALFGRMVTSDVLARGDAAIHVAHAFTVHAEAAESDYFSAVDELLRDGPEEELGSGHIGSTELTSGLFYGYVVVDVPLLVSNLEGGAASPDRKLASQVIERLVHMVTKVSPGAKLGSTAPYAYAHLALVEVGKAQPRTFANAFLRPVDGRRDMVAEAYEALGSHAADLDRMYGKAFERRLAGLGEGDALAAKVGAPGGDSLEGVARWAAAKVLEE